MENLGAQLIESLNGLSWWEAVGVFFGIAYIMLAAKENAWCWAAGLISVLIYVKICFEAQLYAETGLQFFYLGITLYGWWQWKKGASGSKLLISSFSIRSHAMLISIGTLLTLAMGYTFTTYTDAALPYLDSFTTVFSIITTWMVARKKIENWLYWIVVDGAGVYLYWTRELYLTSLLFAAYVIIVIFGYFEWRKLAKVQASTEHLA